MKDQKQNRARALGVLGKIPFNGMLGIEISPHLAPDLPAVRLDAALFRQVLLNLALNAQQAMPRGGLLELQTRCRDGRVDLDVIDNGSGMDEQTLSRVFEAFFSTKPTGSGLGLATVKRIVEAHGGRIWLEDGHPGTRVRFTLPAWRPQSLARFLFLLFQGIRTTLELQALDLQELLQAEAAVLAAVAGHLEAAKGRGAIDHMVAVDPDGPRLDLPGEQVGLV